MVVRPPSALAAAIERVHVRAARRRPMAPCWRLAMNRRRITKADGGQETRDARACVRWVDKVRPPANGGSGKRQRSARGTSSSPGIDLANRARRCRVAGRRGRLRYLPVHCTAPAARRQEDVTILLTPVVADMLRLSIHRPASVSEADGIHACQTASWWRPTSRRPGRAVMPLLVMESATGFWSAFVHWKFLMSVSASPPVSANLVADDLVQGVRRVVAGDLLQVGVAALRVRRQLDLDQLDLVEQPLRVVEVADERLLLLGRPVWNAVIVAASLPEKTTL